MSTRTDVVPDLQRDDTDNIVFHYVDKAKIVQSAVLGDVVTALCGAVFPVTRSAKPGSPVCPACRDLMEMLRSLGS
ncbi:MAG TPA: DUF3039 domain-containing protein [Mycobacteriales bacterium]|nr:DUF3039 domain-containing protein [Mycobacteriales bacterium]